MNTSDAVVDDVSSRQPQDFRVVWRAYPRDPEIRGFRRDHRGSYWQQWPMSRGQLVETLLETIGCEIPRDPPHPAITPTTQEANTKTGDSPPANVPLEQTWLGRWLLAYGAEHDRELALVVYYGSDGRPLEIIETGSGDECTVRTSERVIARRAIELGACGVIKAHNHPNGSAHPSVGDVRHANWFARYLRDLDLVLMDSIVIGRGKLGSLLDLDAMPELPPTLHERWSA